MKQGAIISECGTYRYQLWRIWNDQKPLALYVGKNPSKADGNVTDSTITRLIWFSGKFGLGGFYIGNLFAYRSTDPAALLKPGIDPVGPENEQNLIQMKEKTAYSVFMWGNLHKSQLLQMKVVENIFLSGDRLCCFAKTLKGFPQHPLYMPNNSNLISYR